VSYRAGRGGDVNRKLSLDWWAVITALAVAVVVKLGWVSIPW
jgi:hypothetical protein